jgi:hypothetical protein
MRTKPNLRSPACSPGVSTSQPVCSGISRRCCDALPMSSATSQPRACMKVMLSLLLCVYERPPGRDARPKFNEGGGVHTNGATAQHKARLLLQIAIALNDPLVALSVLFLIFESAKSGRRSRPPNSCGQRPTLDVRASQREPSTRMKAPKAKTNIRQNGEKNSLFRSTVPPTFEFIAAKTDAEGQ